MEKLELHFDDVAGLRHEYERNLQHGRAFVPGPSTLELLSECIVCLVHPDSGLRLELAGKAVLIQDDPPGLCVELDDAGPVADFVSPPPPARHININERMRTMPMAEQQKLARGGELAERVALERMLGKNVWEALLRNPRLTIPEVARIARKGTVPRPLLEQIADNPVWAKAAPVRRALLSNARVGADSVAKILRFAPKPELKLIEKQLGYPVAVRQAARLLLQRGHAPTP